MPRSTREAILDVAEEIYRTEGAEALSMRHIAGTVGVSATALYRHYRGKEDLLNAIADRGFEELAAAFDRARIRGTSARERLLAIVDAFRGYAVKKPAVFDLMFFARRPGARRYPTAFEKSESPSAKLLVEVLRESGVDDPVGASLLIWAAAQGLISLDRAERFESERAFRRAWDSTFQRLFDLLAL
ncbi:MAG TPA: TetR/AcrR family transcriptional regulator [Thermoanaerobaculia bacterium]|jgi:AcrR family transcriptional regulator